MVTRVASLLRSSLRSRVVRTALVALAVACGWGLSLSAQQVPLRKIGELELAIRGLSATTESRLTVPKNVPSGVRVDLRAGAAAVAGADATRLLGGAFVLKGELSGPGLAQTLSLPEGTPDSDPLLLRLPGLTRAGHYTLANLRLVRDEIVAGQPVERTVLDVSPSAVDVEVIDEILITSVTTRPLTLDEIRQKGIVLDADDYLGFEFTLAMKLESTPVNISFPVAFNREGVAVPAFLTPPNVSRAGIQLPTIVPLLLEARPAGVEAGGPSIPLTLDGGQEIRIPSVLVIPGNVGYLKQFFSAQLFVANGAPAGARLTLHDVTGTIALPAGADHVVGTADDPLSLAQTETGTYATLPIRAPGLDGQPATADDRGELGPGEQGQAEFLIRGDLEGFHTIGFDISAALDGLPIGPVTVTGKASGGVLVRNPYFDITFTAPAVVRDGETFSLFATVTNIGQGIANDLDMTLDSAALSGLRLVGTGTQRIGTLRSGDSAMLEFEFESERTGQVVASYLNFDTANGSTGDLNFTVGIGERGVPLSPDTLVLPAAVDGLPRPLIRAAMRVLGQAWSVANAPAGTLRADVIRPAKDAVIAKALALAEAGLRQELGQPAAAALGDLAMDWYVGAPPNKPGAPLDPGLDQIHRDTQAGHALARAFGDALLPGVLAAGGPQSYETARANVAMSGPDFVSFVITGATGDITLEDAAGRRSLVSRSTTPGVLAVPGAAFIPLGSTPDAPVLGLITRPLSGVYTIGVASTAAVSIATTSPRTDGRFARGLATFAADNGPFAATVQIDLSRPDRLATAQTYGGDEVTQTRDTTPVTSTGPSVVSAHIVGPETLDSAGPFGLNAIVLFDRAVDPTRAALPATYTITKANDGASVNAVVAAQAVLSGRFVALSLAQPEGPNVPVRLGVAALPDARGVTGTSGDVALASRLADPGAVVTGRVQQADGTPIAGTVVYTNNTDLVTCYPRGTTGLARATLDAAGRYEFRYVRQDTCGFPFTMMTTDPQSGGRTEASRHVRGPGEQIVVDFTLLGRGTVAGTVRDANGDPVGGATVVARSVSDPQIGGLATTDGDGFYVIPGITVGAVTVRAVRGQSEGHNAGRIDRGGTTATVDVTMDGGTARVEGVVSTPVPGGQAPVRGAVLTYYVGGTVVGYTTTDEQGRFVFDRMPAGAFSINARYDLSSASASGTVGVNETRHLAILLNVPQTGTVTGTVRGPDQVAVSGALVSVGGRGVLTNATGGFTIPGVAVGSQIVLAATPDEKQQGTATVSVTQGQTVAANITLSGLGMVRVTVVGPDGLAVGNATVKLLGRSTDPCGYVTQATGPTGAPAIFERLRLGRVDAKAFRVANGVYDSGDASVSLVRDGDVVDATILLRGFGTITGTVFGANDQVAHGADVVIDARHFVNDGGFQCGMVTGAAHRVRTDANGRFRVPNVGVGPVVVTATQAFAPTPAVARTTLSTAGQTADVTLRLTNTIAGELAGRVLLPDGVTPAGPGVNVTMTGLLPDVTVRTDANGAFHFARVFPEGHYSLTARDPLTGGQTQEQVYLRSGQDLVQDLKLKGRGRLNVTVQDAAGEEIHQAFVKVTETAFPGQRFEGRLDESTEFRAEFDGVFEGPISIEAFELAGNRGGRLSTVMVRDGVVDAVVRLGAVGTVHGTVRMPTTGALIPFATVRILSGNRVIGQATTGEVGDERGVFRFDYVPAGPFRIDVLDPASGRTGEAADRIDAQGDDRTVDVTLQSLGTVTGLVTSNDQPQPAAVVEIQTGFYRVSTLADSAGRYRIEGVPAGRVTVTASLDGRFLAGAVEEYLRTDGQILTLDVALRASSPLTGEVQRFDATAAPLAVVTVRTRGIGGGPLTTPTDATGRFTFDRVPDGLANVEVEVPGSADRGLLADVAVGPGTGPITVRLNGVGRLEGTARDASLNPASGILFVNGTGAFPYQRSVVVPETGAYALADLLAGPVTLSFRSTVGGFTRYGTISGAIAAAAQTSDPPSVIDVTLQDAGTVTLRVLRPDGTPAAAANVRIELSGGRGVVDLVTAIDGRVTATGVPLGVFLVKVTDAISGGVAYVPTASVDTNEQVVDLHDLVLDVSPLSAVPDPADGATDVSYLTNVRLQFSQPLFPGYANGIRLYNGTTLLSNFPQLSADGRTMTFPGPLPVDTEITIVVPGSIFDVFLRHPAPFTSRFRTTSQVPLAVLSVTPSDGATNVATNTPIRVEFSVPVVSNGLRVMYGNGWDLWPTITMSEDNRVATLTGTWPADSELTVEALGSFTRDIYGRFLGTTFQSRFRTVDLTPPIVSTISPARNAIEIAAGARVQVTFSEPIAATALDGVVTVLGQGGVALTGTTEVAGAVVTFTPSAPLVENMRHFVTVTGAFDYAGLRQSEIYQASFATHDTDDPVLTMTSPIGGSTGLRRPVIRIGWSDDLSGLDVATGTLSIDGQPVTPSRSAWELSYTPTFDLSDGAHTIVATVADRAGRVGRFETVLTVSPAQPSIRLTYVQQNGQPGANAYVNLYVNDATFGSLMTNSAGQATFSNVGTGRYRIEVYDADSARARMEAEGILTNADFGLVREVQVTQAVMSTVIVRTFAVGRTPLPYVQLGIGCSECSPATGADGTYTIAGVSRPPGGTMSVFASYWVTGVSTTGEVVVSTEGEVLTLDLELPVSVVRGTVRFTDGQAAPISQPTGSFTNEFGEVQFRYGTVTSDTPGGYAIFGLPVGPFTVYVQDAVAALAGTGSAMLVDTASVFVMPEPIVLEASGSVVGTIRDSQGAPIPGASVWLSAANGVGRDAVSDVAGAYRIDHVGLGPLNVEAVVATGLRAAASGALATDLETVQVDVTLPASGTVSGILRDSLGHPVAGVSITVRSDDWSTMGYAVTGADGGYSVPGIALGPFTVSATTELTYQSASGAGTLTTDGETVGVDLTLPPTGTLTGIVRRHDGTPLAETQVGVAFETFSVYVVTDANGAFRIPYAPLGPVQASASLGYLVANWSGSLTTAGETATATLQFPEPATLRVEVINGHTEAPLPYGTVSIYRASGTFVAFAMREGSHVLVFDLPPGGAVTIYAAGCMNDICTSYGNGQATVTLVPGATSVTVRQY